MLASIQDKEERLKAVYSELDRKFEEEETQRKAQKNQLPYINLYGFPIDQAALEIVPKEQAVAVAALAFYKQGRNLKLGVVEKTPQVDALIKQLKDRNYFAEVFQISKSSFKSGLGLYDKILYRSAKKSEEISLRSDKNLRTAVTLKDLARHLADVSATELVEALLTASLSIYSSDIHIEPESAGIKIRFRIDGVLHDVVIIPKEAHRQLVSRIKILGKLKLNLTTAPQDGSFSLKFDDSPVDIRVSVLPSAFGESIVMRILRQDAGSLKFEDLGITGVALRRLEEELSRPNGMILATGPTGSGKTTSLYAILNKLNEPGVKIITLEDPVEYKIEGLTQTPIDRSNGLTFATALRAVLRQDPDVVMVGEMRDLETAETAAQAALTGHVVLSTLHTNDAVSAIPRLLDLGVKPFVLAPAINAVIAQRLVRKICTKCKTEYSPDKRLLHRAELILKAIPTAAKVRLPKKLEFHHSPGCKECKGLGYKGRIGIYEIFIITEKIEKMIQGNEAPSVMRKQAIQDGMITMAQDGILKALAGITDLEEVFRTTEE